MQTAQLHNQSNVQGIETAVQCMLHDPILSPNILIQSFCDSVLW